MMATPAEVSVRKKADAAFDKAWAVVIEYIAAKAKLIDPETEPFVRAVATIARQVFDDLHSIEASLDDLDYQVTSGVRIDQ